MRPLRHKRIVIAAVGTAVICGLGVVLWLSQKSIEPAYNGRTLSQWLDGLENAPAVTNAETAVALRGMGNRAVLRLVPMLEAHDSAMKLKLVDLLRKQRLFKVQFTPAEVKHVQAERAFEILGTNAISAAPGLVSILVRHGARPATFLGDPATRAETVLSRFGYQVISFLRPALVDEHSRVRHSAAKVLMFSAYDRDPAASAELLKLLEDENALVRESAAYALGKGHRNPGSAIPRLVQSLSDPAPEVRKQAAYALGQYEGKATNAVPALEKARSDPAAKVRAAAEAALDAIRQERSKQG